MEAEPPTWLNKGFLTLALQGGEIGEHDLEVTNFSLKPAVAPGNNYTSRVYRVNVVYQDGNSPDLQTVSLIVKAPLEQGVIAEFTEQVDLFAIEPKIYRTVLPSFSERVKYEFGPKYLLSNERNGLVLKDLKPEGYIVCDKLKQLDIKHCRQVISCLAKFHGASVAYHSEEPEYLESFDETLYKEEGPLLEKMKEWIASSLKVFIESVSAKECATLVRYVSERLNNIWYSIVKYCTPKSNSLNVLNHGDCWTNNILFKYNDRGDIEDVKFIDYQIVRYSSPVMDLIYFIWTSGNEDVRDNHQEELYDLYLKTLNQTLEELNCVERLTREEFNSTLHSSTDWILLAITYTLPFLLCETDNAVDFESVSSEDLKSTGIDDMYRRLYNNKRFKDLLPSYQRQFDKHISSEPKY